VGEETSQGITRRDLLRRGAVLGGAVVWTTPVVQTLGMGRAFASTASPVGDGPDVSYIALVLACDGVSTWYVKWEADGNGSFEDDPGSMQECSNTLNLAGAQKADGDQWLEVVPQGNNCFTVKLKDGVTEADVCGTGKSLTVQAGVVKGGQECEQTATGSLPIPVCL
jgi:hypothetical protein